MTNNLTVFENKQFGQIRTLEENSRILFCGKDVAEALGYAIPRKAIKDGSLDYLKIGKDYRFEKEAVIRWVKKK